MSAHETSSFLGAGRWLGAALLLVVAVGCSSTKPVSMQIDDAAIKTEILAKLSTNGQTNPFRLDVQVSEGVVHLAGTVDNAEEKGLAEHEARSVDGVRQVINDIHVGDVTGGQMADDGTITAKVKAKLAASAEINPFNVDVATAQGIVSLVGRVKTEEQKAEAERIARETAGVRGVRNLLKVGDLT
ncbi:MAG TPA: BON domain-containing protein [Thermoanaerobaculia bacterium]|jgi:hyperosmotically inducible protein|nr:BON domain-containing protein [Thermoanaerobaculia bacterium]